LEEVKTRALVCACIGRHRNIIQELFTLDLDKYLAQAWSEIPLDDKKKWILPYNGSYYRWEDPALTIVLNQFPHFDEQAQQITDYDFI
ncbi:hypothetical protein NL533_32520, partial [Klebsiella pneumoniae]|nr:hypothetical protein [Klebsiella pneumoniae]